MRKRIADFILTHYIDAHVAQSRSLPFWEKLNIWAERYLRRGIAE